MRNRHLLHSRRRAVTALALLALFAAAPASSRPARAPDAAAEKKAILQVIGRMEAAWNRGDFRGYMAGFKNPDVIFVSKGRFQKDGQGTLDHYIRDYGGAPERR